ncbi:hypothetical protein FRB99_003391 [Tulasnella sp. 403]|nr:hypothetical protein FRB99_003391 [Tulasnella sp. 403]
MATPHRDPPHYTLLSKTPIPPKPSTSASSTLDDARIPLSHPTVIHYQYADDPPLHLVPQPSHTILVMDFDDGGTSVKSLSEDVVVVGVREDVAPGADVVKSDEASGVNPGMYVIETAVREPAGVAQRQSAAAGGQTDVVVDQAFIAQFKQRNEFLKKVVAYGSTTHQAKASDATISIPVPQVARESTKS